MKVGHRPETHPQPTAVTVREITHGRDAARLNDVTGTPGYLM